MNIEPVITAWNKRREVQAILDPIVEELVEVEDLALNRLYSYGDIEKEIDRRQRLLQTLKEGRQRTIISLRYLRAVRKNSIVETKAQLTRARNAHRSASATRFNAEVVFCKEVLRVFGEDVYVRLLDDISFEVVSDDGTVLFFHSDS